MRHILIVDDDTLLRRGLGFHLEKHGYKAQGVASAEDALAVICRDPPDLVLMDIGLTGMDGLEARLLDNLVQLGGSVLKTFEIHRRPVHLSKWLPTVLPLWQPPATAKGLTWTSEIPTTLPIMAIDSDRLGQVLGNLLSNAIRYTPGGGAIEVRAGHRDKTLWIEVADTGIGIPMEEQTKVFDPFFRSSVHTLFPKAWGWGCRLRGRLSTPTGAS